MGDYTKANRATWEARTATTRPPPTTMWPGRGAASMLANRWRLGSALVQLSSILDGCDGELIRARLESSA